MVAFIIVLIGTAVLAIAGFIIYFSILDAKDEADDIKRIYNSTKKH